MSNHQKNTPRQNIKGWIVVTCGALFYMYQFIIRVSPNIMNEELLSHFTLDAAGLGILIGVYNWAYSGVQLPLGITMDRFGPRLFLCFAAALCAISCFIFGNTTSAFVGGGARFLMGMGSACGLIGTIKLGTIWLEPKHVAKVTGLTILMGTAGASLGGTPLEILLQNVGFERTMECLGFLGLGISVLLYFIVGNRPQIDHHGELPDIYANNTPLTDILRIIKTPQAWILGLYGMFMYLPITVIGVVWGVSFVESAAKVSEAVAASVVSTMFLGAALGSPVFAFFSDFIKNRRVPMFLGSALTTLIWAIVLNVELSLYSFYVLFFLGGFFYTAKCLSFASICETMPLEMSGVSIAFVNMIVMATGIIFLPLIGVLMGFHWDGTMMGKTPLYTLADYQSSLIVVPIFLFFSGILLFFMKETHPDHELPKEYAPFIDTEVL